MRSPVRIWVAAPKPKHFERSAFFGFGNEAHLWCMKNEAAFGYEALLHNVKKKCALRFTATGLPHHTSAASASYRQSRCFIKNFKISEGDVMTNDKLAEQSMDFAVQIINLVKQLKEQRENIISNQIGRSGTSIGANRSELCLFLR